MPDETLNPEPPRRRFRFSLRQLAAAMVLVAMATVVVLQYREIATLRPELRKARDEAGHLTIDDPAKVYAIAVRELRPDTWSWRVHIPPGKSFWLYSKVNDIPANGFPDVPTPPSSGVAAHPNNVHVSELPPGEWLLTVGVIEGFPEKDTYLLVCDKEGEPFHNISRQPIEAEPHQWPRAAFNSSSSIGIERSTVENAATEPLVLLRRRVANASGSLSLISGTSNGLMIWIAPSDTP